MTAHVASMADVVNSSAPDPGPPAVDDVLDAAADAFVNDGFEAMTFRMIAGRMGVDAAHIESLFESVEQLLVRMLNREYTGMFYAIVNDIERDPLGGRLSRIYRYVLSAVYERPLARSLYLMDRDGHFVSPFNLKRTPEEAAKDLKRYL